MLGKNANYEPTTICEISFTVNFDFWILDFTLMGINF